jgi:predicted ArsR family transcriptional regulator
VKARLGTRASRERRVTVLGESLDRYGYEPRLENGSLRLSNCPFHALSETHRDLVCGMNLNLVEGVMKGWTANSTRVGTRGPGNVA